MKAYISILRFDHWIKNLFVLPGSLIALIIFNKDLSGDLFLNIFIATLAASFIASANYAINEWLDRDFDALHPDKKNRPAVNGEISSYGVYLLYFVMISAGLLIGSILIICSNFVVNFYISGLAYKAFLWSKVFFLTLLLNQSTTL